MQAYSPHIPVGAQHYYKNSFDALRTILKSDGFFGLWRGVSTAILRTAMVSPPFFFFIPSTHIHHSRLRDRLSNYRHTT